MNGLLKQGALLLVVTFLSTACGAWRREVGALQIVYAGKAHPNDQPGKNAIQHVLALLDALRGDIRTAFVPNYDMALGRLLTGGGCPGNKH